METTGPRIGSLFSGYGGLDLGVQNLLGGQVVWHSDIDKTASAILAHNHPEIPNLGDITKIAWSDVPPIDILTGGFPCQDVSTAGRRAGLTQGTRSGLWTIMGEAIEALKPTLVVIENVRGLLSATAHSNLEPCPWCLGDIGDESPLRALGAVLGDLTDIGYDARWTTIAASDVGACHRRERVFVVAFPADSDSEHAHGSGISGAKEGPRRTRCLTQRPSSSPADSDTISDREHREPRGMDHQTRGGSRKNRDAPRNATASSGLVNLGGNTIDTGRNGTKTLRNWGPYGDAIQRWERILGRPAPDPTIPGPNGRHRLSPEFVEWMMGLPIGHVTNPAIGLSRANQLKALGNGVVPQQATAAIRLLLNL